MENGGRFEILEPLGAGALGRLYRARDARLGRLVALRIVSPSIADNASNREVLLADARQAAAFSHPHAAAVLDIVFVRHAHEILCLVHQLADGQPLSSLLAHGPLAPALALDLAAQVGEALAAGEQAGLVHGALDPSNIIVSDGGHATVLDFGLAPWTTCANARAAAARGLETPDAGGVERPSSLYYVSPEQLLGASSGARSDIFALGAILHEMLTGRPAFSGDSAAGLVLQILQAKPEPVSRLNPAVPAAVDAIVLRALAKSLDYRYPSAAALASDLRQLLASSDSQKASQAPDVARSPQAFALSVAAMPLPEPPEPAEAPTSESRPEAADAPELPVFQLVPAEAEAPVWPVEPAGNELPAEPEPEKALAQLDAAVLPTPGDLPTAAFLPTRVDLFEPDDEDLFKPEVEPERTSLFVPGRSAPPIQAAPSTESLFRSEAEPATMAEGLAAGESSIGPTLTGEAKAAVLEKQAVAPEVAVLASRVRGAAGNAPERRGERRLVRPAVWGVAAAAAVIVLFVGVGWFGRNALELPWQDRVSAAVRPKVAVMSFTVAGDNAPPYFGPGFAEDLAARISEIPGSTVVGRTSIREAPFVSDWRARARKLGATFVVRGAIKPGPYAVHADTELLDVATGATVWSQHFAREPRQVAALQAEIAGQLAQRLRLATPTSNRWARASVRKSDPAAYDLYLQGREAADRRDRTRAIALYDQALQRDPGLVEARAALSGAIYLEEYYAGGTRDTPAAGRALREAEAALAVDAELPAAHLVAALAAPTITTAASSLARVLGYDPSNGEAWHHAGDLVNELDPPKAIPFYRASLALEPSIDANWRDLASAYAAAGNADAARDAIDRGEAARPDRPWWKQMRARLEMEQGRYEAATQALGADPSVESAPIAWLMGRVVPFALANRMTDARREAARLVERYPGFCEGAAVLSALERDTSAVEQGRQRAGAILAAASGPGAEPPAIVCAALAAAGTGDPAEAASWMSKLAGDERALRLWTRQATFGHALSFRQRWYPWNKVAESQPMQVATGQLNESLQRIRDEVERRLPTPPGPNTRGQ